MRRGKCAGSFEELGRGAGARRVDGKNVDAFVVVGGIQDVVGGVVGHKPSAAGEAVELGIATCVGNARRVALNAEQHNADTLVLGIFSCAKTDGTAATVGVHEHIALVQIHAVDSELIEQLGLLRVGLIKRGGEISNSQPSSWSRMHSAPYTMRVSSPRMALPGRPLMFWATVTMCGLSAATASKNSCACGKSRWAVTSVTMTWSVRQPQRTTA